MRTMLDSHEIAEGLRHGEPRDNADRLPLPVEMIEPSFLATIATRTTNGCPYPGGEKVLVGITDVIGVGVLLMYGDARKRYMVRLYDGREGFVTLSAMSKDAQRAIHARKPPLMLPDRLGFSLAWNLS